MDPPVAAAVEKRPYLLPWNCPACPNGQCRPKEPVNVTVNVPAAPAAVDVAPSPPEPVAPSFPWGLLFGVLIPTVLVAAGVAFAVRMRAAAAADPQ